MPGNQATSGSIFLASFEIKLRQQVFEILIILLRHHGDIVAREQLPEQLWPADTFVHFDHSLNPR